MRAACGAVVAFDSKTMRVVRVPQEGEIQQKKKRSRVKNAAMLSMQTHCVLSPHFGHKQFVL